MTRFDGRGIRQFVLFRVIATMNITTTIKSYPTSGLHSYKASQFGFKSCLPFNPQAKFLFRVQMDP